MKYWLLLLLIPIYLTVSQTPAYAQATIDEPPIHEQLLPPGEQLYSTFFETNVPWFDAILSFLGLAAIVLLLVNAVWAGITIATTGATELLLTSLLPSLLLIVPAFPYLFNGNLDKALKAPFLSALFTLLTFFSVALSLRWLEVDKADNFAMLSATLVYAFYFLASFIDAPQSRKRRRSYHKDTPQTLREVQFS